MLKHLVLLSLLIATGLALGAESAHADGLLSRCATVFMDAWHGLGKLEAPWALAAEKTQISSWGAQYMPRITPYPLHKEHTLLVLSDLPQSLRKTLFTTESGAAVTEKVLIERLTELELLQGPGHIIISMYGEASVLAPKGTSAFDFLEKRIKTVLLQDPVSIRTARDEIERRMTLARGIDRLANRYTSEYRIKVSDRTLTMPDGGELRIERMLPDGTLLVNVASSAIIRTQDFLDHRIVDRYVKQKDLGTDGFWGEITPNGSFRITDQHHRVEAYAHQHGGKVLVRIPRASDGNYYTITHYELMNFDSRWSRLPDEVKLRVAREAAAGSPIEAIRPVYYR